ncbi:MAG: hypothetical protein PHF31_07195 [Methylobacter sp.]|nr:hypothetical protein [Methylobacter sp.]
MKTAIERLKSPASTAFRAWSDGLMGYAALLAAFLSPPTETHFHGNPIEVCAYFK